MVIGLRTIPPGMTPVALVDPPSRAVRCMARRGAHGRSGGRPNRRRVECPRLRRADVDPATNQGRPGMSGAERSARGRAGAAEAAANTREIGKGPSAHTTRRGLATLLGSEHRPASAGSESGRGARTASVPKQRDPVCQHRFQPVLTRSTSARTMCGISRVARNRLVTSLRCPASHESA